mgnify:CR=1 FL=1
MCHVCVYAMYVCMPWCMCVYVLWSAKYVLYVCYDLPCMCCMCAMICHVCAVCVLWSAMYVCMPCMCVIQSLCLCQNLRKPAKVLRKWKDAKSRKYRENTKISEILENRPFIIDHFIRHFTLQMTGQVGDRFWDFGVRLPTKQSFLTRQNRLTREFRISGVGTVAERLFPKKKAPNRNNCAQIWPLFQIPGSSKPLISCDFQDFVEIVRFRHFCCVLKGIHAKPWFPAISCDFLDFLLDLAQILDLLGLPPTWYLLASISRRKLATHIPWTLRYHGCYVASSIEIDDAKTIQIFASWLT